MNNSYFLDFNFQYFVFKFFFLISILISNIWKLLTMIYNSVYEWIDQLIKATYMCIEVYFKKDT